MCLRKKTIDNSEGNEMVLKEIERTYKDIELSHTQDSQLKEPDRSNNAKFIKKMTDEIELQLSDYLYEYPNNTSVERVWDQVKSKMLSLPLTKKRLQILGWIWRSYRENSDRKKTMESLGEFLTEKGIFKKDVVEPFDASKLRLITTDFIS